MSAIHTPKFTMDASYLRNASTTMTITLSKIGGAAPFSTIGASPGIMGLYGKYPELKSSTAIGMNALARKRIAFARLPAMLSAIVRRHLITGDGKNCNNHVIVQETIDKYSQSLLKCPGRFMASCLYKLLAMFLPL